MKVAGNDFDIETPAGEINNNEEDMLNRAHSVQYQDTRSDSMFDDNQANLKF